MRSYFILFVLLLVSVREAYSQPPPWLWAKNFGKVFGYNMAVDNSGNIYVAGEAKDGAILGSDTIFTNGKRFPVLIKHQPDGNVVWTLSFAVSSAAATNALINVCVDSDQHLYISGRFNDTLYYSSGVLISSGGMDAFMAKVTPQGQISWIKKLGGLGENDINGIVPDGLGNLWVAGYYRNTGEFDNDTLTSPIGFYSVYLAKYDTAGNLLLLKHFNADEKLYIHAIDCDYNGNPVIAGSFTGTIYWDSIPMVNNSADYTDPYVVKLNGQGAVLWAQRAWSSFDDEALDIKVADDNSIYITGSFRTTLNFVAFSLYSAGNADAFVAKYSSNGTILWGKSAGGTSLDDARRIIVDAQGSVYVWGSYNSTATFGGTQTLSSTGYNDLFVAKYTAAGNFLWVNEVKNIYDATCYDIALTPQGKVVTLGAFGESLIVGDTMLMAATLFDYDMFLAELDNSIMPVAIRTVQPSALTDLTIAPNPSNGYFMVTAPVDGEYFVCDEYGKTVLHFYATADKTYTLHLPMKGIFFIRHSYLPQATKLIVR